MIVRSVETGRVRDDSRPAQGIDQRRVGRIAGAAEQRAAVAVEDDHAGPAEVERSLGDRERAAQQCGREHARHAPAGIHGGHRHDDHARAVHAALEALAHVRLLGGEHVPEIRPVGQIEMPRDGAGRRGDPDAARGVQPAEPCVERAAVAALEALEVVAHGRGVAVDDRRRAGDRPQSGKLPLEVRVDDAARDDRACAFAAQCRALRRLVLAPGERPGHRHEQQHGEQQPDRKLAAVGDPATRERVFDLRGRAGLVRSAVGPIHAEPRPPARAVRGRRAAGERREGVTAGIRCIRNKCRFSR